MIFKLVISKVFTKEIVLISSKKNDHQSTLWQVSKCICSQSPSYFSMLHVLRHKTLVVLPRLGAELELRRSGSSLGPSQ